MRIGVDLGGTKIEALALADDGRIDRSTVTLAIRKFGIDPDKPEPLES